MSSVYRELAALSSGAERKRFLLVSADAWHSWPATSYTRRQEERDRAAAAR
jgi:hypothetical protein